MGRPLRRVVHLLPVTALAVFAVPGIAYATPTQDWSSAKWSSTKPPPPPAPPPPEVWQRERDTPRLIAPRTAPEFPGFAFLEGHTGRVTLVLTVGDAGTVTDAWVDESTGYRELDDAALRAVRQWQFNKLSPGLPAYPRHVRAPFNFSLPTLPRDLVLLPREQGDGGNPARPALEWPTGYLHPRYQPAVASMSFHDALETVQALAHASPPVAGGPHMYAEFVDMAEANGTPKAIWFALDPGKPYGMIVRYTFSGAPNDPRVSVAAACPSGPSACAQAMPELLRGPFFARAATTATDALPPH